MAATNLDSVPSRRSYKFEISTSREPSTENTIYNSTQNDTNRPRTGSYYNAVAKYYTGMNRFVLLFLYCVTVVMCSSIYYNWSSLSRLLIRAGIYHWHCPQKSFIAKLEGQIKCNKQFLKLANLLVLTRSVDMGVSAITGYIVDRFTLRYVMVGGGVCFFLAWICLGYNSSHDFLIIIAFILFAISASCVMMATLNVMNLFWGHRALLICFTISFADDLSTFIPVLLNWAFTLTSPDNSNVFFRYMSLTGIPLVLIGSFAMPLRSWNYYIKEYFSLYGRSFSVFSGGSKNKKSISGSRSRSWGLNHTGSSNITHTSYESNYDNKSGFLDQSSNSKSLEQVVTNSVNRVHLDRELDDTVLLDEKYQDHVTLLDGSDVESEPFQRLRTSKTTSSRSSYESNSVSTFMDVHNAVDTNAVNDTILKRVENRASLYHIFSVRFLLILSCFTITNFTNIFMSNLLLKNYSGRGNVLLTSEILLSLTCIPGFILGVVFDYSVKYVNLFLNFVSIVAFGFLFTKNLTLGYLVALLHTIITSVDVTTLIVYVDLIFPIEYICTITGVAFSLDGIFLLCFTWLDTFLLETETKFPIFFIFALLIIRMILIIVLHRIIDKDKTKKTDSQLTRQRSSTPTPSSVSSQIV
uniref:Integral membrane protein, putative n=1 Tax=Theileria annulata TaxID=5874 RepID=A0A3B0MJF5_THEAN